MTIIETISYAIPEMEFNWKEEDLQSQRRFARGCMQSFWRIICLFV